MAGISESLKKITYESLQQFVEDINRNFAIIQNSPLYKGIPGNTGEDGKKGARGERGARFFFINADKFLESYAGEVVNINSVNQIWINQQISDLIKKEKLLKFFNVNSFVDTDIIVLTNSKMIQYNALNNSFSDTGISFYQQNTLISSIENKIEQLVRYYVDNNPKVLSIKNILIKYRTYAKVYSSTNNSYITQADSESAVYMPYFAGITDTQGALIPSHNYFGFSDELFPIDNKGAFIIGSVAKYSQLLSNTLNATETATFSSDFAPTKDKLPNLIIMQDTNKNGIMFGYKNLSNLSRFASIYKDTPANIDNSNEYLDSDIEEHNLVLKSDQGINPIDFSRLLINRYRMRYDKQVFFDDNLTVAKDFYLIGNIENKFIRTAEFIKSKYTAKDNNTTKIRSNTIELGANVDNSILINVARKTEFPYLSDDKKLIVLTVNRPISDSSLSKAYFVEEGSFIESNNENLDDFIFNKITSYIYDENYAFVRTPHILSLKTKLNHIQQYVKENYWRRDEWENTNRGDINGYIPKLNVGNTHIELSKFYIYNGSSRADNKKIFDIDGTTNTLTLGYYLDTEQTQLNIPTKNVYLRIYNLEDIGIIKNDRQANQIVTSDDSGNLNNTGVFVGNSQEINKYVSLDKNFVDVTDDFETLVSLSTLSKLQNLLVAKFANINDIYWKKNEYATPADNINSTTITEGKIPNIYVKNALGGKYIKVLSHEFNENNSILKPKTEFNLETPKIILNSSKIYFPQNKSQLLVTKNDGQLIQAEKEIYTFETVELEEVTLSNVKQAVTISIVDAEHHVLTSDYLLWLNNRINKVVENGLGDEYWKKVDFVGDINNNFVIPTLNLKNSLEVTGTVIFHNQNKSSQYFNITNNVLALGHQESNNAKNSKIDLVSKRIRLNDSDFYGKVLVTWKTDNINEDEDSESKENKDSVTKIEHQKGEIRKDITLCEDLSKTEDFDNLVPTSSFDKEKDNQTGDASKHKTKDKHVILTGRTLKWIMGFMNAVKKRFLDTFNKTETLQHMHDILPVGSIIMWTKTSYELACYKDKNFATKKSRNGIPNGWWPCNGTKIADTSFVAPDMRNQFVRGVSNIDNAIGVSGKNKQKIKEGQLPNLKHTHSMAQSGEHRHLLTIEESDEAYYTGEFVYKNDLTFETIRQKMGVPCNETDSYSEGQPIIVPDGKTNYIKLKNVKVPVIISKVGSDAIVNKNNWFVENIKQDATLSGNVFKFAQGISAGISIFDYIKNFLTGNSFKISNIQGGVDISKHRHPIDETGLGMSTEEKQGWIYNVPEYYKVIFIIKYDNSVNPNNDPVPDPIVLVTDLPSDDGKDYVPPVPDQSSDYIQKQTLTIIVNANEKTCSASINDSVTQLDILEGDSILLTAIPGPKTSEYFYQLRYWKCDDAIITNSYDVNEQGEKIGKKEFAVIPTKSCTYQAFFEKIELEPIPPAPVIISPIVNINTNVNIDGYNISEIENVTFSFKGVGDNNPNVNVTTTKK